MIVFTGFAIVLRQLSIMDFSAKQFAFLCETFTVIVNITVMWGLGFEIRTFAAIVFTGFCNSFAAIVSNGFFCKTVCFSL